MFQRALGLAALVVLLDQLSKWAILELVMQPPRVVEVLPFFNLVLTFNRGISFGLFRGHADWQPYVLVAVSLVIVTALLIWLRRQARPESARPEGATSDRESAPIPAGGALPSFAIGLVVGGAIGNVIDRLRLGAVVDFLDVHVAGWHWPAFNVADSAITIGVGLLILDGLFPGRQEAKQEPR